MIEIPSWAAIADVREAVAEYRLITLLTRYPSTLPVTRGILETGAAAGAGDVYLGDVPCDADLPGDDSRWEGDTTRVLFEVLDARSQSEPVCTSNCPWRSSPLWARMQSYSPSVNHNYI